MDVAITVSRGDARPAVFEMKGAWISEGSPVGDNDRDPSLIPDLSNFNWRRCTKAGRDAKYCRGGKYSLVSRLWFDVRIIGVLIIAVRRVHADESCDAQVAVRNDVILQRLCERRVAGRPVTQSFS